MGNRGPSMQWNAVVPVTPVVRALIITCVAVWLILQIIVEKYVLSQPLVTFGLGLVPLSVVEKGFVWQLVTYQFLHSANVFHIVFNMLMLWWLGSELEARWGSRFFFIYYIVTGFGAGLLYVLTLLVHGAVTHTFSAWMTPVVGASGAIFGLLLAYGMLFGERIVYFMMVFPMRAKIFVGILAAVEVATLLNSGIAGNQEANLAHLGGFVSGYLYLKSYTWIQQRKWRNKGRAKSKGLKLVVNNENKPTDDNDGPKYWN